MIQQLGLENELCQNFVKGRNNGAIAIRKFTRRFDDSGLDYWGNCGRGYEISFKEFTRLVSEMAVDKPASKKVNISRGYDAEVFKDGTIEIHNAGGVIRFSIQNVQAIAEAHKSLQ